MRWFKKRDPNACRIEDEWQGIFIGRHWCSTHRVYWDGPLQDHPGPEWSI